MLKKTKYVAIFASLLLLLSSCAGGNPGGGEQTAKPGTTNPATTAAPSETSATETTAEEPSVSAPKVKLEKLNIPWELTYGLGEGRMSFRDPATELWGYCDFYGNVVLAPQYGHAYAFTNGYAHVSYNQENYLIDKQGNLHPAAEDTSARYYILNHNFRAADERYAFDLSTQYGYTGAYSGELEPAIIDINENPVFSISTIESLYPDYTGFGFTDNYVYVIWHTWGTGYTHDVTMAVLDYDGNVVIEPNQYDYIIEADENHFWVANYERTYGLIDKTGRQVIEPGENPIFMMLDYEESQYTRNHGYFFFSEVKSPNGFSITSESLFNYQVVNCTGRDLLLIVTEKNGPTASAQIYDVAQEKVVGVLPSFSMAAAAKAVYLLPGVVLHQEPVLQCYDYEGNLIEQDVFPQTGYRVEEAVLDGENAAVVNLDGGRYSGYGHLGHLYIRVSVGN